MIHYLGSVIMTLVSFFSGMGHGFYSNTNGEEAQDLGKYYLIIYFEVFVSTSNLLEICFYRNSEKLRQYRKRLIVS